jgi:LAS seventeen-binding protein 1/2
MYKYTAADDRDLSFDPDDRIAVYEYMNDDWWMGRNEKTLTEGIFPKNYVEIDRSVSSQSTLVNEKAGYYQNYAQPQPTYSQGYPQPPPQQSPYNSSVPPVAVAEESGVQGSHGKTGEMGKKIGKKLGNAAIFGAGATIGSNIVNSIF